MRKIRYLQVFIILIGLLSVMTSGYALDNLEQLADTYMQEEQPVRLLLHGQVALELYYLYLRAANSSAFSSLTNSTELDAHDSYRIVFTPTRQCYVYIFQVNSTGELALIFPELSFEGFEQQYGNPVEPGRQYNIPAQQYVFDVGNPPRLSDIYVLVAEEAQTRMSDFYGLMLEARGHDPLEENDYRDALLSFLESLEQQPFMSHIRPIVYRRPHAGSISPVTVREFVNWLSFNASPAPAWGRKGPADRTVTLFHLFYDGSAELTPEAVPILSAYRKALREHSSQPKIKIMVHTDMPGTAEANQVLSEQRAHILRQFFTNGEEGIERQHLIAEGYGNTQLLTDDVKKRSRINNRVELIRLR